MLEYSKYYECCESNGWAGRVRDSYSNCVSEILTVTVSRTRASAPETFKIQDTFY